MKNPNFDKYQAEAEESFFGFEGDDFFAANKDASGAYGADGGNESVAVEQPDFQRTFTLQLFNTLAVTQSCTLFNAQQNLIGATFGLPATVTFTSMESNIATVYSSTMFSPMQIVGFRMEANAAITNYRTQLAQPLTVAKNDLFGVSGTYRVPVNSYVSLMQQIDYAVDVKPYRIDITGQTGITFNLLADQTVTFTFYVGSQIHAGHALHGRPSLSLVTAPLPMSQSQPLTISKNTLEQLSAAMGK